MNPLEREGQSAVPAQLEQPTGSDARAQPASEPDLVAEPAPETQRASASSNTSIPSSDSGQAAPPQVAEAPPEPEPAPAPSAEQRNAADSQPAAAPDAETEVASVADDGDVSEAATPAEVPVPMVTGTAGGSAAPQVAEEPEASAAIAPAPQIAANPEAAADDPSAPEVTEAPEATAEVDPAPQAAEAPAPAPVTAEAAAVAPEPAEDPAPMVAMTNGGSAGPVAGDAGPDAFTGGPQIGGGVELSAPAFGGDDSSSIAATGSDRPIRTAAAPQQVTAGNTDTGAKPAVNTESAAMPEIGGSELEEEDVPLGPPPSLQAGAALADNAAVFSGNSSRPLMSIVLVDTGEHPDLRPGLTALTAPITFGVEADVRDAESVARDYRNAGFEVTAVLPVSGRLGLAKDLPEEQVEPLLARVFDRVPVAATVMEPIGGPLPKDRRMANAVLDALEVTGHGLLTHRGKGLNNLPIIAAEKGVASDLVYRVIDEQPGPANISLALERAVLDASRSGHVIVVGTVRQETVTTLFSWLLGSGAREVTIAPASAVLRRGES